MFTIEGKYTKAKVYADDVELGCMAQISTMTNHPAFTEPIAVMPDCHEGKGSVIGFTMPLGNLVVPATTGVDIGCFRGDTKIPLLNGSQKTISSLIGKGTIYVYSLNKEGKIVPGEAIAIKTRENTEIMKVCISGGEEVICTPDQLFMLTDMSYKKAEELKPGDSLMPLYRAYHSRDGYETIRTLLGTTQLTHKMVAKYYLEEQKQGYVIHHLNGKWYDNSPNNLVYKSHSDHSSEHAKKSDIFRNESFKKARLKTLKEKGFFSPDKLELKRRVAIENITNYMQNNNDEWHEKIKDNGKRGAKYLREFNKKNNSKIFTCECGREIKGRIGFIQHQRACNKKLNHKVLYIERLNIKEDVYCLQVKKYHNFAISAGVFVHNCGISAICLGKNILEKITPETLDRKIRAMVPFGFNIHESKGGRIQKCVDFKEMQRKARSVVAKYGIAAPFFDHRYLGSVCKRVGASLGYVQKSLGTLGGGNHFIEFGRSMSTGEDFVIIHTGSRNFGLKICNYWQKKAAKNLNKLRKITLEERIKKIKKVYPSYEWEDAIKAAKEELGLNPGIKMSGMEFLEGEDLVGYLYDMILAQGYASANRNEIARQILSILGLHLEELEVIETIHNYISFRDMTIRKGAISAHKNELIVIPLNMRDGTLICRGKGNPDWNYSAPHGAGRKMSRRQAKDKLSLDEFQDEMKDIFSTSVVQNTLDEAPGAYKDSKKIISSLEETAEVRDRIIPVHSMKSA